MNPEKTKLSEQGEQRRSAMLGELVNAMDRHHRVKKTRRRIVYAGSVVLVIGLLIGASVWMNQMPDPDRQADGKSTKQKENEDGSILLDGDQIARELILTKYRVNTNIQNVEHYFVSESAGKLAQVEYLSDDQLVSTYHELGQVGFVAEIGNEKVFLTEKKPELDQPQM